MLEFWYDTQLLIEEKGLNEDEINDYFNKNFKGDCLLAVVWWVNQNPLSHQRTMVSS